MPTIDHGLRAALLPLCLCLAASPLALAKPPDVVAAGPGTPDVSPHQVVRTSGDVLYAIAPDCPGTYPCGANRLHAYQATASGTASSYVDADAAHAPTGYIRSSASRSTGSTGST